jgi:hypothetical protein
LNTYRYTGGGEVVVVKLRLYYSSVTKPLSDPANDGFGRALEFLRRLEGEGFLCEIVDTIGLSEDVVYKAYADAWLPSVSKKLGIRRVFGTRRRSGCFFGREVPALLVYEDDDELPVDVYPREELGRIVPITEFLEELISDGG